MMIQKITTPSSFIIEQTALQLASAFYEIGRGQGLPSKHKTARHYAAHNVEKFVPHAIVHLREIWLNPNTPNEMRAMLHDVFMERINDPVAESMADSAKGHVLPNLEIAKVIPIETLPSVIKDKRAAKEFSKDLLASTAIRY